MSENVSEEHFLFIVRDVELAERLRAALGTEHGSAEIELHLFMQTPRVGMLYLASPQGNTGYAVTLHELPTLVETYKSHNHVNLVKSADIGQALLLHPNNPDYEGQSTEEIMNNNVLGLQGLEADGTLPREVECGITPPMHTTAKVFKKPLAASPEMVETVETQIIALMNGEAPDGWVIEDVAEMFVDGKWVPVSQVPPSQVKKGKGAAP